jgi:hypothetical protein
MGIALAVKGAAAPDRSEKLETVGLLGELRCRKT